VTTRKNPGLSVTLIAVQLNVPFVDTWDTLWYNMLQSADIQHLPGQSSSSWSSIKDPRVLRWYVQHNILNMNKEDAHGHQMVQICSFQIEDSRWSGQTKECCHACFQIQGRAGVRCQDQFRRSERQKVIAGRDKWQKRLKAFNEADRLNQLVIRRLYNTLCSRSYRRIYWLPSNDNRKTTIEHPNHIRTHKTTHVIFACLTYYAVDTRNRSLVQQIPKRCFWSHNQVKYIFDNHVLAHSIGNHLTEIWIYFRTHTAMPRSFMSSEANDALSSSSSSSTSLGGRSAPSFNLQGVKFLPNLSLEPRLLRYYKTIVAYHRMINPDRCTC
jgi:hypothetical protein